MGLLKRTTDKTIDKYEEYLRKFHDADIHNISAGANIPYELIIDYMELETYDVEIADLLIEKSDDIIKKFQRAFANLNRNSHNLSKLDDNEICNVRIKNISEITPVRELTAENVGKLIQTNGVISNYTLGHQIIYKRAVFICRGCSREIGINQTENKLTEPSICEECGSRSFTIDDDKSTFTNLKNLIISEPIDELEGKTRPQSIIGAIKGEREFVEKVAKAGGKKINIVGKVLSLHDKEKIETVLLVNNLWSNEDTAINLSAEDIAYFKQLAEDNGDEIINLLVDSFAEFVIYPPEIKTVLLCQRVGAGKVGNNRKNINVFIVGDRGIGKTRLATETTKLYPVYKKASGTGASGVGLLGAVDRDTVNGGWTYEAGAIVLADGGLCVIDEFDKIPYDDQPKVNDLLEDGVAQIDKATVHVEIRADVRALALANPAESRFNLYESIRNQIGIDGSTFDRFDGVFALTAEDSKDQYENIRKSKYESYKRIDKESGNNTPLNHEKLNKYLQYVELEFNPVFNHESEERGLKYHDYIANSEFEGQRQSDSLDRFAGAIAKLRQHEIITVEDVDTAYDLICYMANTLRIEIIKRGNRK